MFLLVSTKLRCEIVGLMINRISRRTVLKGTASSSNSPGKYNSGTYMQTDITHDMFSLVFIMHIQFATGTPATIGLKMAYLLKIYFVIEGNKFIITRSKRKLWCKAEHT